ncbi:hypothetical protein RvY_02612-2 [Ramazzottius varieornatus]|uniref:Uncharacterized protein n=1 Tax=Ramazzottius varieornatus TaxID=947166 RepID=A0A1D1UKB9_RAMVA|nr:hypothetical protein RvY_02612-2 [Ramazzottius varieornatus]
MLKSLAVASYASILIQRFPPFPVAVVVLSTISFSGLSGLRPFRFSGVVSLSHRSCAHRLEEIFLGKCRILYAVESCNTSDGFREKGNAPVDKGKRSVGMKSARIDVASRLTCLSIGPSPRRCLGPVRPGSCGLQVERSTKALLQPTSWLPEPQWMAERRAFRLCLSGEEVEWEEGRADRLVTLARSFAVIFPGN